MGAKQSKIKVLLVSRKAAGKTEFINRLVYGVNTTTWSTVGTHQESVVFENTRVEFFELGSQMNDRREILLQGLRFDCIYFFVDESETGDELLMAKNVMYQIVVEYPQMPLCVIYNHRRSQITFNFENQNELLQLNALSKRIPVCSCASDNFEYILHWTVRVSNE